MKDKNNQLLLQSKPFYLKATNKQKELLHRTPLIANSFGLVGLINSDDLDDEQLLIKNSKKWKIGMSIKRPNFHLLTIYADNNQKMGLLNAMKKILEYIVDEFKVDNKINSQECIQLAITIVEKYKTLSLEDFYLFYMKVKEGFFGKTYNRIDSQIILEWLSQFDEMVDNVRSSQHKKSNVNVSHHDAVEIVGNLNKVFTSNEEVQSFKKKSKLREQNADFQKFRFEYLEKKAKENQKLEEENLQSAKRLGELNSDQKNTD